MKTLTGKSFIKILEKKGWALKRINGSHHVFSHTEKMTLKEDFYLNRRGFNS